MVMSGNVSANVKGKREMSSNSVAAVLHNHRRISQWKGKAHACGREGVRLRWEEETRKRVPLASKDWSPGDTLPVRAQHAHQTTKSSSPPAYSFLNFNKTSLPNSKEIQSNSISHLCFQTFFDLIFRCYCWCTSILTYFVCKTNSMHAVCAGS